MRISCTTKDDEIGSAARVIQLNPSRQEAASAFLTAMLYSQSLLLVAHRRAKSLNSAMPIKIVITSYSIHYTKLYDRRCRRIPRLDGARAAAPSAPPPVCRRRLPRQRYRCAVADGCRPRPQARLMPRALCLRNSSSGHPAGWRA